MKTILTSLFLLVSLGLSAQTKAADTRQQPASQSNARTSSSSIQTSTSDVAPLPYDVNDKYMGRKLEILNVILVPEIPSDFPIYEKQWSVSDYNSVVDAYYMNHKDILKPNCRAKIEALQGNNK